MFQRTLQCVRPRGVQHTHFTNLFSLAAVCGHRFTSSADPTSPSLSKHEADLLQRVHYLRERAIDLEKRTNQALERAGHLPQSSTPLASVAARHMQSEEEKQRAMEGAAQPSLVTDMADWLEEAMEKVKVKTAEQRLLAATHGRQQKSNAGSVEERDASGRELDELAGGTDEPRQETMTRQSGVNDEVKQQQEDEDTDVRLGPIPVVAGPAEPVWIAVPLRSEGVEGEQRAEEQQAASEHAQQQQQAGEAEVKDDKHIHRQLPEDRATGRPEKETGVSTAAAHSQRDAPNSSPRICVHFTDLLVYVSCEWLAVVIDWSSKEGGRVPCTHHQQHLAPKPCIAALIRYGNFTASMGRWVVLVYSHSVNRFEAFTPE